ncbi:DNA mismatch endonuclease Vsr [Roseovarius sp. A21]|uniref:DNA mismatch endonuclease Vsr n=1 Tax=Roseovarius bejariae TaxID=2576383 RepID=A0A844D191_9RHOB|nr:DNA mismatch endonuclease Vsr [Roseovarius bejariae]MRU14948.1 DNA mismatch endonuclease Vsr [Roseovarius bejariae]
MPDVHDTQTRSRNMAAIKARNTKPEIIVRKGLHHLGFRYRLHDRALPGTPDIVLKRYRAIIDVRSCFFHGHDCSLFRLPETRREFWQKKIWANVDRDRRNLNEQLDLGWRTAIV